MQIWQLYLSVRNYIYTRSLCNGHYSEWILAFSVKWQYIWLVPRPQRLCYLSPLLFPYFKLKDMYNVFNGIHSNRLFNTYPDLTDKTNKYREKIDHINHCLPLRGMTRMRLSEGWCRRLGEYMDALDVPTMITLNYIHTNLYHMMLCMWYWTHRCSQTCATGMVNLNKT